jgi:hypothetical protein
LRVSRSYDNLTLYYREPPRAENIIPLTLAVPGAVSLPGSGIKVKASLFAPEQLKWPPDADKEAYLDFDQVLNKKKPPPLMEKWIWWCARAFLGIGFIPSVRRGGVS